MRLYRYTQEAGKPRRPARSAIRRRGTNIWMVHNDEDRVHPTATEITRLSARLLSIPRRNLPEGHPLRGKRLLNPVPAGSGDIEIDDDGDYIRYINDTVIDEETTIEVEVRDVLRRTLGD